jgi:GNAT superfamily N-acetyltransferase
MSDGLDRAVAFQREFTRRRTDEAIRSVHGTAYLMPTLPKVYDLNVFFVDPGTTASAAELIADADRIFTPYAELAHRKIAIDDGLGSEVEAAFRETGWQVEELVVMPHVRDAAPVDVSKVEEVTADELVPVWEAGMRRDIGDEDTVAQLVQAHRGRADAVGVRYFATRVGGLLASYCELFSDGQTGQIESVMTEEAFRGRGLGKAVVAAALAASRVVHDFTFIVADAHDWPRELYRTRGFESAGSVFRFLRRPPVG